MWNKRRWFALVAACGWLIMAPTAGLGSGFALGCAVVARADDLSAMFYNPAGLVQLPGFQVMGGLAFIVPRVEIVTQSGGVNTCTLMDSQLSAVPHFFASYQISDRVSLGLGVNSPFGLGIRYSEPWPGSANVIKAAIQTVNINPTVAVKITDYLAAGGGLDIMYFNFYMKRQLPLPFLGPQTLYLKGDTWGLGFNLGLHLKPRDDLSLGVSYRSQVKQQVDGPAQFQPYSALNTNASGSIILPDTIFAGIMVRPLEQLSVELGVIWTHWSLFKNFNLKFDNPLGTLSERKNWHDTWRGQVGVEYRALPWLDLRAGYALENEPMPDRYADYLVPSSDRRHNFSFGPGFRWRSMTIDVSYTLAYMPTRSIDTSVATGVLPSTFQGRINYEVVCSLGYKF